MYTITKRQLMILTLGGFLSYLLFGIFDSMRGTTLSPLLSDLHFNYASGGTIVMGQYAGYFAATLLAGILADRTGPKFTLVLAAASLLFGVVGYSASSGMFPLIAFIFFIGIGLGSLELGGCNIITALYQEKKGRYLNILAAIAGYYPCDRRSASGPGDELESNLPHWTDHRGSGRLLFCPS